MSDAPPPAKPAQYTLLPSGHRIADRYRVLSVIGEGAQGVVYLAVREPEGFRVALKVLHRHLCGDPQIKRRFHREAEILKQLDGEHLVRLFDFIEEDGLLIIALEYIEGTSLEARLKETCPLEIKEAVEITLQICAALGAAHAAGIVHRDLKPANVLLEHPVEPTSTRSADRRSPPPGPRSPLSASGPDLPRARTDVRVRVVDFGVAKMLRSAQMTSMVTAQGTILGTPEYMAPEQARGDEADARSDLYAAGVMLYEMAVGRVPFKGWSSLAVMTAHLAEAPQAPRIARPGGAISASLDAVILRALQKSPADRYPSARAFAEALAGTRDEHRVIGRPPGADPELLAVVDTELQVNLDALATAKTMPVNVVSDALKEEIRKAAASRKAGDGLATTKSMSASDMPTARSTVNAVAVPVYVPPGRSGWLWAVIAIIAAAVGVVLGAIIGAR
jgi:serine/threonine protein kinase